MKLKQALKTIQYSSQWGIWAEQIDGLFSLESDARFGQQVFENGGMLDDYKYVCNGKWPADRRVEWCEGDDDGEWDWQFMDHLIDMLNEQYS